MNRNKESDIRETVYLESLDRSATKRFEMHSHSSANSFKSYYKNQLPINVVDREGRKCDIEWSAEELEICPGVTGKIVESVDSDNGCYQAEIREITVLAVACPVIIEVHEEYVSCSRDGESDSQHSLYHVAFDLRGQERR